MSRKQAEEMARQYIAANRKHLGEASAEAIENAVKRVAIALQSMKSK